MVRSVRVSREVWVEFKEDDFPTNNILSSNLAFTVIFYTYLYKQRHLAIILKQHPPSFTFSQEWDLGYVHGERNKIARYSDRIIWVYYGVCSSWLFFDAYFLKIYFIHIAILPLPTEITPYISFWDLSSYHLFLNKFYFSLVQLIKFPLVGKWVGLCRF